MYRLISVAVVCIAIAMFAGGAAYTQDKDAKKDDPKPKEEQTATPEPEKKAHETTFYDLKITSKRLIFVIDVSGSMLQSAKEGSKGFGGGFGGGGAWGGGGMMGGGMMGRWNNNIKPESISEAMPVSSEQALEYAQEYLDNNLPGVKVSEEITPFYGYYTRNCHRHPHKHPL